MAVLMKIQAAVTYKRTGGKYSSGQNNEYDIRKRMLLYVIKKP
jgi:hypothetical protein